MNQGNQERTTGSGAHRSLLGLRVSALGETLAFLAVALLLDAWLGAENRFSDVSPHPFWIIVLLVSTYYGTNEGLATAALCAIAALAGQIPEQSFSEDRTAWLLRVTADPVLWIMAALLLGEIRSGHRHRYEALQGELENARRQVTAITSAYDVLSEAKAKLELRVAAQAQTVPSLYRASRSIERQATGDALAGIPELVRSILAPKKFSVFLVRDSSLRAAAREGWQAGDNFVEEFTASSPLFQAVVARQQVLQASDPSHELTLAGQGILAAPLVHGETGAVFGMLKIEQIGLTGLSPSTVQNVRIACDWIGAAYARAQRIECLIAAHGADAMQRLLPGSIYDSQRAALTDLARESGFDACALYVGIAPEAGSSVPDEALVARSLRQAAGAVLSPTNLRFNFGKAGWTYAVLLPGYEPQMADDVAQRFTRHLCTSLAASGYPVRSRYLVEILHRNPIGVSLLPESPVDAQQKA